MGDKGWIGVDLDATLATYDVWRGQDHIGEPIPLMVQRVRQWIEEGKDVRIFTARVSHDGTAERIMGSQHATWLIREWCKLHIGCVLPITCQKDWAMVSLWDDRVVQVIPNTGELAVS